MNEYNLLPEVGNAVCQAINVAAAAGSFNFPIGGAERTYEPVFEVKDSERAGLVVVVMAKGTTGTVGNRGFDEDQIKVDVGIWKRIPDRNPETIDPLLLFVRQMWGILRTKLALANGTASFISRVCEPIYMPELLKQNQFLSVTTFTYLLIHRP